VYYRPEKKRKGWKIFLVLIALFFVAVKTGILHVDASGSAATATPSAAPSSDADDAALLAKALTYDSESYVYGDAGNGGGGHPPAAYKPGMGLDCSGLVDVTVLQVTGINENNAARDFRNDKHWAAVDMTAARAGDIVYLLRENHAGHTDDHVGFVVSNDAAKRTLVVFEAATWETDQPDQIRQKPYPYAYFDGALRFHR